MEYLSLCSRATRWSRCRGWSEANNKPCDKSTDRSFIRRVQFVERGAKKWRMNEFSTPRGPRSSPPWLIPRVFSQRRLNQCAFLARVILSKKYIKECLWRIKKKKWKLKIEMSNSWNDYSSVEIARVVRNHRENVFERVSLSPPASLNGP